MLFHHHGLQEKDRKERGSKTDIFTRFELWRMKFPDTNDIRYRCNDIDECRKSNDVEQERIERVNLVIMMTDIDEKTFKALNQLEQAIVDYIDYYNNKRIKVKLKGLSPVQYRTKSFT